MDTKWLERLFDCPDLLKMGHAQAREDLNLGLGWLYYAQARLLRPRRVVCIGSWRGFAPMVLAKALLDNRDGGRVTFVDPSLVDDFWADPHRSKAWFAGFGIDNIDHHRMTTQQFITSDAFHALQEVGLLFVDGFHSAEQARLDHEAFKPRLRADAAVFFHDGVHRRTSAIYGPDKAYEHSVCDYIEVLRRDPTLQVMSFPMDSGVVLVTGRAA